MLLQNNDQGEEQPTAFFNKILRDGELKYSIMEKKAYALVKALKDFRIYILHSHIISYVPCSIVKSILTQLDPEGKRAKWVAMLLQYDIEIKTTKLIKGKGLDKMMTDSHCDSLQLNFLSCQFGLEESEIQVKLAFSTSPWYADIVFVLQNLQPPTGLSKT